MVDNRLADILNDLKLKDASDYEKVKTIHDYIINLASYDTTYRKSSVYDILMEKTSVCEGYALAAYRLFIDAGLDCRIISGKGNKDAHAWNIVKVDGQWYNIDLTWDDPITNTGEQVLRYDYFLKSERDFTDHIRDGEFNTTEFINAYPIAGVSYPIE
jgi:transglutaminase/protease-like cytokinesis protein 3